MNIAKSILSFAAAAVSFVSLAASPAATQLWVSNYVGTVTGESGEGLAWFDGAYMTFTSAADGEIHRYPVQVATPQMGEIALYCFDSQYAGVPSGTLFAYDVASNCYRNAGIKIPPRLDVSTWQRPDGTNDVILSWTNSVYKFVSGQRNDSEWVVNVTSNRQALGFFRVIKADISHELAKSLGVTNTINTSVTGVMRALDVISRFLVGDAYADSVFSSLTIHYTFKMTIDGWGEKSGTGSDVFTCDITLSFHGPTVFWPDPDHEHYYSPSVWPLSGDWRNTQNWKPVSGKCSYNVPVYNKKSKTWVWETVTAKVESLEKRFGTIASKIPNYRNPTLCQYSKTYCQRYGHFWWKCQCTECKKTRPHNLVEDEEHPTWCFRCDNLDGNDKDPDEGKAKCQSTRFTGGDTSPSPKDYHRGWHHVGVEGNAIECTCECGEWKTDHDVDESTKSAYFQGKFDLDTGDEVPDSKDRWHWYYCLCAMDKGDGTYCTQDGGGRSQIVYNELHNWDRDKGFFSAWKWSDGEKVICEITDPDADVDTHYSHGVKCLDCEYESTDYLTHDFPGGDNDIHISNYGKDADVTLCVCKECGLLHHAADSWMCGNEEIVGCPRCNTRPYGSSRKNIDYESHSEQLIHTYPAEGINENGHVCTCGKVNASHWKQNDDDDECAACGYKLPNDWKPPEVNALVSITNGVCGYWLTDAGTSVVGGNYPQRNGIPTKGAKYYPTRHEYDWQDNGCMLCTNRNPVLRRGCYSVPTEESRHRGWHDVNSNCVCLCEAVTNEHLKSLSLKWRMNVVEGVTNCEVLAVCLRQNPATAYDIHPCNHTQWMSTVHMMIPQDQWRDADPTNMFSMCSRKHVCTHALDEQEKPMCGFNDWIVEDHLYTNFGTRPVIPADYEYHSFTTKCEHCHKFADVLQPHKYGEFYLTNVEDAVSHHWAKTCCVATDHDNPPCGFTFVTNFPHGFTEVTANVENVTFHHISNHCDHVVATNAIDRPCGLWFFKGVENHNFITNGWVFLDPQYCAPRLHCTSCGYEMAKESAKEYHWYYPDVQQYSPKSKAKFHFCQHCENPRAEKPHEWTHYEEGSLGPHDECLICGLHVLDDTIEGDSDQDVSPAPIVQSTASPDPESVDDMMAD